MSDLTPGTRVVISNGGSLDGRRGVVRVDLAYAPGNHRPGYYRVEVEGRGDAFVFSRDDLLRAS
jgi:hypothetical protein